MTQDDIERINRFVGLQRPRNNKQMIELYLFLVVGFFMFFFGTSMVLHFNLLKSNWMIFAVFALVLLIWGTILIRNYMKRQIDYFLICGAIGLYYAAEFFSLGYTVGIYRLHVQPVILIILILFDIPLFLMVVLYRRRIFQGKEKKKAHHLYPLSLTPTLIIVLTPFINNALKKTSENFQDLILLLVFMYLGYGSSMLLVLWGNYFVARKYKDVVYLYEENGSIQKGAKKKKQ